MAEDRVFKILSIDGGGIKGLYSATLLRHLEEKFSCNMSDYFDMLCGTSTGGLIALALSLNKPASEICRFYEEEGPKIFYQHHRNARLNKIFGSLRQALWRGKFSDKPLKEALERVFGEAVISQSENLLCIPSYTITEARPWVFKFDHKEGNLDRDNSTRYVDVALATAAAPTYFPMAEIESRDRKQFIDGGVWSNNPSLVGFIEALDYFVGEGKEYNKLQILSIGSLTLSAGKPVGTKRERSFFNWGDELFETSLSGQSYLTHYFLKKITTVNEISIDYLRIPSPIVSPEHAPLVQLDVATPDAINMLRGKGNDQGKLYSKRPEVAEFFKKPKTYSTH